jgi:uncharacterized protein YdaU (DUF1376 family)
VNYYERYVGDYQRDTAHLSLAEHGAYNMLLDTYYATERPLPADDAALCRICRAFGTAEQKAVKAVADQFFPVASDGLRHSRKCDEVIADAQKRINAAKANGKKGGRPQKLKTEEIPKTNPSDNPTGNPVGFDQLTQRQSSPTPAPIPKEESGAVVDSTVVGGTDGDGRTAPRLPDIPNPPTEIGHWCSFFIREGFDADKVHTIKFRTKCGEWAAAGVKLEQMREAMLCGDVKNGGRPESPMWYANFLQEVLQPKAKTTTYASTDEFFIAKGTELGLKALAGESMPQFRARVQAAMDGGGKQKAPAPQALPVQPVIPVDEGKAVVSEEHRRAALLAANSARAAAAGEAH